MRIALLTREYLPETAWGGIGSFYRTFATSLRDAGHQVEVFTQGLAQRATTDQSGILVHTVLPRFYLVGRPRGGELGGMFANRIGSFALALALAIRKAWIARHRTRPFDIVEAHEHLGIGSMLGRATAGAVHVERYHVAYDLLVRRRLEAWPTSGMVRWLERRSLDSADLRIATTHFIDRQTQLAFPGVPPADDVIPIANGISVSEPVRQEAKERLIVFVGRLSEVKRPAMMARAFARLVRATASTETPWRLEIAGADAPCPRGDTYWAEMRTLMGNTAEHCRYWGPVDRPQLFEILRRARVIAVPSAFESFGLAALEAMTFGCIPVVANDTALPEIVGDTGAIFENGDEDAFVEALRTVTALPAGQLCQRSERASERSNTCFTGETLLRRNLEAFAEALRAKRGDSDG